MNSPRASDYCTTAPVEVVRYFNWDSWTRDLGYDYTTADSPSGGVFVFRNQ